MPMIISQSRLTAMMLDGRKSESSTELFVQIADASEPVLYLELWSESALIGYARLDRCESATELRQGRSVSTFALSGLLSADSPAPHPVVALSGVLWNRRELASELGASPVFPHQEVLPEVAGTQQAAGSNPHEA
ncbi:hypothetical protein MMK59_006672, partial [Pseudomonas aeruginosa]